MDFGSAVGADAGASTAGDGIEAEAGAAFTFGGGERCPEEGGGAEIPIPGPMIPVARQVAVVAAPAVQIAAIFCPVPARAPAVPASPGCRAPVALKAAKRSFVAPAWAAWD
ncbi:MAG TPA: hypothetical protein VND98_07365, partial [Solirubrobacterales bacterium]|nr:hypothetical protein [Solirubrobacterales bacterium]